MEQPSIYQVPSNSSNGARVKSMEEYKSIYESSIKPDNKWWGDYAKKNIEWMVPFDTISQGGFEDGDIAWFLNGKLNVSVNCVDRHARETPDKIAIIHEGDEPGNVQRITYKELLHNVCRMANVLKSIGVKKGDTVCIYMPMVPEAAYAMLACYRIGAIHSVVFAGFSAEALASRIEDGKCQFLLTANEGVRGGKRIGLKKFCDSAMQKTDWIKKCLVFQRTNIEVNMKPGRDEFMTPLLMAARPYCAPELMDSEDPLFILYTSGSTGKPKGMVHTTGGYLTYAHATCTYVFDLRPNDVYACVADIGWITGHTYIVTGPLACGGTTVMFESTPLYPDSGRYWDMVSRHKITQFYTAPTALRALQRCGDDFVLKYDRSSLRILGVVGEPTGPSTWRWYHSVVGNSNCSIVDTWWQTETGGNVITPLPGATPQKPGSATFPFFGQTPVLLDSTTGEELTGNNVSGVLCLKKTWPSIARTVWGDHQRYLKTYMHVYPGYYFTGDGAIRDEDGYLFITGRVDDVLSVSGHRLGTAEIESALLTHNAAAEAAIVAVEHEIKGQAIFAYVSLKANYSESPELISELKEAVKSNIGKFANPDYLVITNGLPKTRSGKLMRRLLRGIAVGKPKSELGDISTLSDYTVVDTLISLVNKVKQ